ncbi:MAG: FecR domain-containing protein, partial [Bacteroidia bacterium]
MKNLQLLFLLAVVMAFTACGSVSVETADNFEQVVLPDSSVVYLNHKSKISYNKNFTPRTVNLEGEAFFSVNDGTTPFTVKTESGEDVVVKGTEFFMAVTSVGTVVEVEQGLVAM